MTTNTKFDVQVLIASGADNPCRARLGFEVALASMASGLSVVVFLTGGGVLWGTKSQLGPQFGCGTESARKDIYDMIGQLLTGGVRVEACSACVGEGCLVGSVASEVPTPVLDGVVIGGLTAVAIRSADVNTMTF